MSTKEICKHRVELAQEIGCMCAVGCQARGIWLPKHIGAQMILSQAPDTRCGATGFYAFSCWVLMLLWSHLSVLCPYFFLLEYEVYAVPLYIRKIQ